jgi:Ca2+-binding RTX toxin-like protein
VEQTWVFGGPDDDTIWGSGDATTGGPYAGKLVVDGGAGDDTVAGGAGDDCLTDTGAGGLAGDEDLVDYSAATSSVIASLTTGIVTAGGLGVDTLVGTAAPSCETFAGDDGDGSSFEDLVGSDFNDTLTGDISTFGNIITPGAGDDSVSGAAVAGDTGDDYVDYSDSAAGVTVDFVAGTATGNGNDTLTRIEGAYGSDFDDTFVDDIESANPVFAGAGNDLFDQGTDPDAGDGDSDLLDGEGGTDTIDYSQRTDDLVVSLNSAAGSAGPPVVGCGGDVLNAPCADGDVDDGEEDDLQGIENANLGTGDDTFTGSAFNNVVNPGGGQNVLDGAAGSDSLDYTGYESGVTVNMAGGSTGGDSAVNFENAKGSSHNDNMTGNSDSNTLNGRGGSDNLKAGGGDDTVRGGAGNDKIRGGSGDDDLFGARGNDYLNGGSGTDLCKGGPGKDKKKGCELGGKN